MTKRCVVFGCSYMADFEKGIGIHNIPFLDDDRPKAKKRRKLWVEAKRPQQSVSY